MVTALREEPSGELPERARAKLFREAVTKYLINQLIPITEKWKRLTQAQSLLGVAQLKDHLITRWVVIAPQVLLKAERILECAHR